MGVGEGMNKILAILIVAIFLGLSGAGNMLTTTTKAESYYTTFEIGVWDTGDGVYDQNEKIYFDGVVENTGSIAYEGTFHVWIWIETLGGTYVTTILNRDFTQGLGVGQEQDLDPGDWTSYSGGYFYVCGEVTYYEGAKEDTDSHLFRVRYL